jgi:chromosomal replication initiation ATPase DnaA
VQLAFSFSTQNKDKFSEENFIKTAENSSAYKFLEKFFQQEDFESTQFPVLIIKGESKSGKTHLLNIFAKKYHGEFIDKNILNDNNPLNIFAKNKFFIVDDFALIDQEERILALLNSANEARVFLILSDNNQRKFTLKDLNSRLKNIFASEIKNPSQETMKILISNQLSQQQIKISGDVIDEITFNAPRTYNSIEDIVKKIIFLQNEQNEKLTKNNLAKLFKTS